MTIKTSTGSSKTELSSRGKRPFKVRRSGANYGPCPSARKRPALITDPQKFGPTLNIGPAVIMDFKVSKLNTHGFGPGILSRGELHLQLVPKPWPGIVAENLL